MQIKKSIKIAKMVDKVKLIVYNLKGEITDYLSIFNILWGKAMGFAQFYIL